MIHRRQRFLKEYTSVDTDLSLCQQMDESVVTDRWEPGFHNQRIAET